MESQDSNLTDHTLKDRRTVDALQECLIFLAKYHKREISQEALTCDLSLHNRSMDLNIFYQAANKIGLIPKKVFRKDINSISQLALPAVLLLDEDRACVLLDYDIEAGIAKIILPGISKGETEVTIERIESEYTGQVLIIKPEFNFRNRIDKEIVVEQPKEWFWGTLKRNKDIYTQVVIASLFINIFIVATPLFTMNVYDRVLPNNAIDTLWALVIGIFVILSFDFVLKLIRSYFLGIASKRSDVIMSNKIFDQLLNIKLEEKPASTGLFVSRLQSFESVRDFFTSATVAAIIDLPFVLIFLLIIFYIGGPVGYVTLFTIIITLLSSWYIQRPLKNIVEKNVKEEQIKQTTMIETVTGLEIIKSIRAQNRMKTNWEESVNSTVHYNDKGHFLSQGIGYFITYLSSFSNIGIVALGVYLAADGYMTMGAIIASMMLNGRVIGPVSQLSSMIIRYDRTMLALNNLDEVMKMPVEREKKDYISRANLQGKIEFKDVNFSYKNKNIEMFKNLNFKINKGEKVAILGKIGCGKSTLIKLILNLYSPTSGSVLVDDVDTRQIDPVDLRKAIGVVPQEPFLFMGSIKDNITISEQYATDEEILRASKIAGLEDFLAKHELGYDLMVGERGEGLSGGEKQTVTLARALLSDPNILMLDEPTNSMDSQTENAFIKKLKMIIKNKTLIVVTHKLSLLELVDRVIIIENGQIIADGPKEVVFNKLGAKNASK